MNRKEETQSIILGAAIVIFWSLSVFLLLISNPQHTLFSIVSQCAHNFFNANPNNFQRGQIGSLNGLLYFYIIFFLSIASALFFKFAVFKNSQKIVLSSSLLAIAGSLLFMNIVFQTAGQYHFFRKEIKTYSGLTLEKKKLKLFQEYYLFSSAAGEHFKDGCRNADLKTDLDIRSEPFQYLHNLLAYYLYPIDIRNIRKEPKDCFIAFSKEGAIKKLSPDYEVKMYINDDYFLAVKKSRPNR